MKWSFGLILIFLSACVETPPNVDFSPQELFLLEKKLTVVPEQDRPAEQGKNVLVEDVTGVKCINCPDAATKAGYLRETYPGRVVVVGLYTKLFGSNLTDPLGDDIDLRTDAATDLHSIIYGAQPLPGGGVDRKLYPDQSTINQSKDLWKSRAESQLTMNSLINLDAELVWVNDTTVDLITHMYFQRSISEQVHFSIMLLEDGFVTQQKSTTGVIPDYLHKHVLRKMYTPFTGTSLVSGASEGNAMEASWRVYLPDYVNKANASLVFFLNFNEENNKEVIQCLELKL